MNLQVQTNTYPWYVTVKADDPLQQGDFVLNCPVAHPTTQNYAVNQTINADVAEYDVIIMSQSCDLMIGKIDLVLVCPFYTLTEYGNHDPNYKTPSFREKLRQGHVVGLHLLNKIKVVVEDDYLIVDFKNVYSIPLDLMNQIVLSRGERMRLLPPYREHLAQAFARFFMRVGLPVDIPQFK